MSNQRKEVIAFTPTKGWHKYNDHIKLIDFIYETLIPLVNKQEWSYMNFTSGSGIFEDQYGNVLILEFQKSKVDFSDQISSIIFSHLNLEMSTSETMIHILELLQSKYGLVKSVSA